MAPNTAFECDSKPRAEDPSASVTEVTELFCEQDWEVWSSAYTSGGPKQGIA